MRLWLISLLVVTSCIEKSKPESVELTSTHTVDIKKDSTIGRVDTATVKPEFDYFVIKPQISTKDEYGTKWVADSNDTFRFIISDNGVLLVYKNAVIINKYANVIGFEKIISLDHPTDPLDWITIHQVDIKQVNGSTIMTIKYKQKEILFGDIGEIVYSLSDKSELKGNFKTTGPEPIVR